MNKFNDGNELISRILHIECKTNSQSKITKDGTHQSTT